MGKSEQTDQRKYKESFVFVETMYKFALRLPEEKRFWMLQAIIEYGLYGKEPVIYDDDDAAWMCFENARASIDSSKQKRKQQSEAGKKSGESRRSKKTNGVRTNVNGNANDNGNGNANLHDSGLTPPAASGFAPLEGAALAESDDGVVMDGREWYEEYLRNKRRG